MRNEITQTIEVLTDEQLKQCYFDIKQYNKCGMMGDTLVRQIRNTIAEKLNDKNYDCSCRVVVIPEILYEIAKRFYEREV